MQVGHSDVDQAVEQVVLAGGAAVDRARVDAELGTEPADRERVKALAVGQHESGLKHAIAVRRGLRGRRPALRLSGNGTLFLAHRDAG